jgi:SAM-dependent methyltransferase
MSLKEAVKQLPGVSKVQKRFDRRTLKARGGEDDPASRSRLRWRSSRPDIALTWGKELSGEAFIKKAVSYDAFAPGCAVLEIGPGYGRLVRAALDQQVPFDRWVGVDLSVESVDAFNETFGGAEVRAVAGDAESVRLDERFDTMVSSLTLKHIFPTFERALVNVSRHLQPGGSAVFDLIEGGREFFERRDQVTFIRQYTRAEVADFLGNAGLRLVGFDDVDHDDDPAHRRLLVVARKPG